LQNFKLQKLLVLQNPAFGRGLTSILLSGRAFSSFLPDSIGMTVSLPHFS
jgi:hypothetical protein